MWLRKKTTMQILKGPTKGVRSLAFSPDGNSLAAGCYDGTLRLWNLLTGEAMRLGSFGTTPKSLIWTPDGLRIIWSCGSFGFGRVCWTTIDGLTEELIGKAHDAAGVCLTPDGRTLYAATAHAICRRDIVTGIELRAWKTVSPAFLAVPRTGGRWPRRIRTHHWRKSMCFTSRCGTSRLARSGHAYWSVTSSPTGWRLRRTGLASRLSDMKASGCGSFPLAALSQATRVGSSTRGWPFLQTAASSPPRTTMA